MLDGLTKNAQEIATANLADLVGRKSRLQHGIDDDIVKTGFFARPGLVGSFTDVGTLRAGAWAGWCELGVCSNANVVDPDDIDKSADILRVVERGVGKMSPNTDCAA